MEEGSEPVITQEPTIDGLCPVDQEPWSIHCREDENLCRRQIAEQAR